MAASRQCRRPRVSRIGHLDRCLAYRDEKSVYRRDGGHPDIHGALLVGHCLARISGGGASRFCRLQSAVDLRVGGAMAGRKRLESIAAMERRNLGECNRDTRSIGVGIVAVDAPERLRGQAAAR